MKWLPKHTPEHTGKRVRIVIEELKSKGVTVFGATGYCYGGTILISCTGIMRDFSPFSPARLVFDLAFDNVIKVSVVSHPSLLNREDLDVRRSEMLLRTF